MTFIAKEIPTGVINGINKVFTLLNDVDHITSLYINGAIYIDFIRVGRVITLSDAPTSTIWVDYYTTNSITPIVTNTKLSDLHNKIIELLGQNPDSTNFSPDILTREINDFMQELWRGKIMNIITGKYYRTGDMFFQENYYSFRISKDSVTTAPIEIGDTEISMSTTGLNASGWVMIGGDYIQYTSITATTIEGVSGITTTHNEGVVVKQLYVFPENYDMLIEMDEVSYQYSGVRYTPIDTNGVVSFDILRVGSVPLMQISGLGDGTIVRTKYITKYSDMSDIDEDFRLPDRYGTSCIAYIIAGQMAYDKLMPQGERLLNKGYASLLQMIDFYTRKTKHNTKIIPKPYSQIGRTYR